MTKWQTNHENDLQTIEQCDQVIALCKTADWRMSKVRIAAEDVKRRAVMRVTAYRKRQAVTS